MWVLKKSQRAMAAGALYRSRSTGDRASASARSVRPAADSRLASSPGQVHDWRMASFRYWCSSPPSRVSACLRARDGALTDPFVGESALAVMLCLNGFRNICRANMNGLIKTRPPSEGHAHVKHIPLSPSHGVVMIRGKEKALI